MKNNSPHRISTEITTEKIKIMNDIDLNALFNLNYNFDLLKGIIETLLKNQGSIQKQLDEIYSSEENKDKNIQTVENDISLLKENSVDKNDFKDLKAEVEKISGHIKQNDKKIEECKFIIFII